MSTMKTDLKVNQRVCLVKIMVIAKIIVMDKTKIFERYRLIKFI